MWYSENDFRIFAMMIKYSLSPWYLYLSGWEHWMKELLACNWSIIDSHVQLVPADTVRHYDSMHYSLVIDSHYWHCTLLLTLYSHTQTAEASEGGQTTKTNWWPLIIGLYISDVIRYYALPEAKKIHFCNFAEAILRPFGWNEAIHASIST